MGNLWQASSLNISCCAGCVLPIFVLHGRRRSIFAVQRITLFLWLHSARMTVGIADVRPTRPFSPRSLCVLNGCVCDLWFCPSQGVLSNRQESTDSKFLLCMQFLSACNGTNIRHTPLESHMSCTWVPNNNYFLFSLFSRYIFGSLNTRLYMVLTCASSFPGIVILIYLVS